MARSQACPELRLRHALHQPHYAQQSIPPRTLPTADTQRPRSSQSAAHNPGSGAVHRFAQPRQSRRYRRGRRSTSAGRRNLRSRQPNSQNPSAPIRPTPHRSPKFPAASAAAPRPARPTACTAPAAAACGAAAADNPHQPRFVAPQIAEQSRAHHRLGYSRNRQVSGHHRRNRNSAADRAHTAAHPLHRETASAECQIQSPPAGLKD